MCVAGGAGEPSVQVCTLPQQEQIPIPITPTLPGCATPYLILDADSHLFFKQIKLMLDSGAGVNLISLALTKPWGKYWKTSVNQLALNTANGTTSSRNSIDILIPELYQVCDFQILPIAPPVLSLGVTILDYGCSFLWLQSAAPL